MPLPRRLADPRFQPFFLAAFVLVLAIAAAAFLLRPTLGKVTVDTRPPGGAVLIEGHYCPAAPCDFELEPGEYHVEASFPNYQHAEGSVDVTAHGSAYKTLHLLPMNPTPEEAKRMGLILRPKDGDPVDLGKR
jgi:hypothetical protein